MDDARGVRAEASPRSIDLSAYDTVWLVAPIWLYHPTPPIRAFVENNRFDGQRVVLFNTYNSRIDQASITDFKRVVLLKGACAFEHLSVRRGRMESQVSPDEILAAIDDRWFVPTSAEGSQQTCRSMRSE